MVSLEQHETHLKRAALNLVSQLPDNLEDARRVLAYAERLLTDFVAPTPPPAEVRMLRVVTPG